MNANELADELEAFHVDPDGFPYMIGEAIAMLRQFGLAESIIKQQQLEIESLKAKLKSEFDYVEKLLKDKNNGY
jgi:hypothetical protein